MSSSAVSKSFKRVAAVISMAWPMLCLLGAPSAARAAGAFSVADLEAATRTLGFVDSLRRDGTIVVGVVHVAGNAESKHSAESTAAALAQISGPNSATIKTQIISTDGLPDFSGRLDAVFLLPGVSGSANEMGDAVRKLHLISISNDPGCIETQCCVLMVRTGRSVEIVLDTTLAEAVGARFSSVFTMMVKRK